MYDHVTFVTFFILMSLKLKNVPFLITLHSRTCLRICSRQKVTKKILKMLEIISEIFVPSEQNV